MLRSLLIYISFLLFLPTTSYAEDVALREITVLADESLHVPLVELARLHAEHSKTAVNLWFASAAGMIDAIRDGADADIVITADANALQTLEYLGQLDVYATQSIAVCPLVIAVRDDEQASRRDITLELMGLGMREGEQFALITISEPSRTEYGMTQQALTRSELLKNRPLRLTGASNPREAKALMLANNSPALLLATDVFTTPGLRVAQRFPSSVVKPALYKAAVLAGDHMKESRRFIEAIQSQEYRKVLERYGLGAPEKNTL